MHADDGVFVYRRLVEYLDLSIPIYGLQEYGLANPGQQSFTHVDEMATHSIREIRTVQPQDSYRLCAFLAGGLIIFEMRARCVRWGSQSLLLAC